MSTSRSEPAGQINDERREHFMKLLMPVYKRLEDFAVAMTRDREEACDLVAETLLRAYENFSRLKDEKAFLSYLFTIASREHQLRQRRRSWFGLYNQDTAEKIRDAGTTPDISADVEILYKALARLPMKQREAVVLFEISGFSLKELQEVQGGSIAAIKVRLFRARKRLAELLGVEEPYTSLHRDEDGAGEHSGDGGKDIGMHLRTITSR